MLVVRDQMIFSNYHDIKITFRGGMCSFRPFKLFFLFFFSWQSLYEFSCDDEDSYTANLILPGSIFLVSFASSLKSHLWPVIENCRLPCGISSPEGYIVEAAELREKALAGFITTWLSEKRIVKPELKQTLPSVREC